MSTVGVYGNDLSQAMSKTTSSVPIAADTPLKCIPFASESTYTAKAPSTGIEKITQFRIAIRRSHRMRVNGFAGSLNIGRFLNEAAYKKLDSDQKIRLMDGFSRTRAYSMIPLLVLVGAYWFLITRTDVDRNLVSFAYFALLIAYVALRTVLNQRKLLQLDMPADYKRFFAASQIITSCGAAWLFFTLLYR